ncbi:MAG TPA: PLP-dependent aminotransferase family protein [Acidimicrobiales bacterium]
MDARSLYSDIAGAGAPLFFPDPPAPVTFNFDQGIAAEETFPIDELKALACEVLDRDSGRALEYISFDYDAETDNYVYIPSYIELVLGYTGLREQVAKWIGSRNNRPDLSANNIILTSGSVQAIALAINGFVNRGDGVLVESATFPYAMRYMEMRGADIRSVELDDNGLVVESLEHQLENMRRDGVRPKLLYTIPTFQLPTGVCTPLERRERIIELAEKWDLVVLEDSIYADLRFEGQPIPSLLELDTTGRVMQSHGFSKVLAPALRLGWITAHPDMLSALAAVRQDLGVSQWLARVMEEYVERGRLDPHIEMVNSVYRRKRDVAAKAVNEHCTPWVSFTLPKGGFYLWLQIAPDVDWEKASHDAAMNGVFFRPGEVFMGKEEGDRFIRLAYSHVRDHEIERGIAALGDAIRGAARARSTT